jgi:tRNA(Ile)-lysidine synthase
MSDAAPDADALLTPLASHKALLLAVSGGPDSVALMLLASRWSQRARHRIEIATVDHGLRPESTTEARRVGEWAHASGFPHHALRWLGDKPASRIQERARDARYALLAQCAREIGAEDCAIVTAHHADDQAETVLFRLTRGSGVAGLAGMAPASTRDGVALLRPLLGLRKRALEELCAAARHPFLRDPSNADESYARPRLRALGDTLASQGLDGDALLRLGRRAARANDALDWATTRLCDEALLLRDEAQARFSAFLLRAAPQELLQRLTAREIARLRGPEALRLDRLENAAQALREALENNTARRITLGGALLEAGAAHVVIRHAPPRKRASRETSDAIIADTDSECDSSV